MAVTHAGHALGRCVAYHVSFSRREPPVTDPTTRLNAALEGRYRIERMLGEGGMATVYLADDLKHERKVALKVLKPELAAVLGAERFLTEIKTTANLQHPHILPLHDSGEADGLLFYVMPFVEGESLQDRLQWERQLPVEDAVEIATNVAEALDYAHRHGVVHRDIKPANVLLLDGKPVISDFGIALAVGNAGGHRLTETGLSVGTPYYMSPEQATGDRTVGPATDTYALGCVLYEMLIGEPPYTGSSPQAILGKIIKGQAESVRAQRKSVPANVDAAISRSLEKLAADRFTSVAAFAAALKDPGFETGRVGESTRPRGWSQRVTALLAGLVVLFLSSTIWALSRPEPPRAVSRYSITLPAELGLGIGLSRDGSQLAYVARGDSGQTVWWRPLDQLDAVRLPIPTGVLSEPFFSPDGQRLAFFEYVGTVPTGRMTLRVLSLDGGSPIVTLTESGLGSNGWLGATGAWGEDGFIYASGVPADGPSGLVKIPEGGGAPSAFTTVDTTGGEGSHFNVDLLPNGKGVLFTTRIELGDTRQYMIAVADTKTGTHTRLIPGRRARYVGSGHIVYGTLDGRLMAAPFDQSTLSITGEPVVLISDDDVPIDADLLATSQTGSLVYGLEQATTSTLDFFWVTWDGTAEPVDPGWSPPNDFGGWSLSPDDARLALNLEGDVWIKQLDRGPLSRLTFDRGTFPVWTPDGQSVVFRSSRAGNLDLYVKRADGGQGVELLQDHEDDILMYFWSGDWLFYQTGIPHTSYARDVEADGPSVELHGLPNDATEMTLSPDGQWLAYMSRLTGEQTIEVRPFPDPEEGRWQVATGEKYLLGWANSGRELLYLTRDSVFSVDVLASPTFAIGSTQALFATGDFAMLQPSAVSQRFLGARISVDEPAPELIVVLNFLQELKRLMPK